MPWVPPLMLLCPSLRCSAQALVLQVVARPRPPRSRAQLQQQMPALVAQTVSLQALVLLGVLGVLEVTVRPRRRLAVKQPLQQALVAVEGRPSCCCHPSRCRCPTQLLPLSGAVLWLVWLEGQAQRSQGVQCCHWSPVAVAGVQAAASAV